MLKHSAVAILKNIIKYCNRPWEFSDEGREAMNHTLIENLMALPEGCTLLNLGDWAILHGHIHNNPLHREDEFRTNVNDKLLDNYINCCADVHDFKPVLFAELIVGKF